MKCVLEYIEKYAISALFDDKDKLVELVITDTEDLNIGDIYFARVVNVLNGNNAALVDVGKNSLVYLKTKEKLIEGASVKIKITAEANLNKQPKAVLMEILSNTEKPKMVQKGELPIYSMQKRYNLNEIIKNDEDYIEILLEQMFELDNIEVKINGGSLKIEKTTALWAIDVDAGSNNPNNFNFDVLSEIVRQILIRNISGIIIIDPAGAMESQKLYAFVGKLKEQLKNDFAKAKVLGFTKAGLIEITRQRSYVPLVDVLQSLKFKADYFFYELSCLARKSKNLSLEIKINKELLVFLNKNMSAKLKDISHKYAINLKLFEDNIDFFEVL